MRHIKLVKNDFDVIETIKNSWSARAFSEDNIPEGPTEQYA